MGHDRPVQGEDYKARLSVCLHVMEHPWGGSEGSGGKGAQVWFYGQVLGASFYRWLKNAILSFCGPIWNSKVLSSIPDVWQYAPYAHTQIMIDHFLCENI